MINLTRNHSRIFGFIFLIFILSTISISVAADIVIEGKLIREQSVCPGDTYDGYIQIKNISTTPVQLKIYQTDYLFSHEGWSRYPEPAGQTIRSNANWIYFKPSHIEIPPHEKSTIHYRITVPPEHSLNGTYWSMLMIEEFPVENSQNNVQKSGSKSPDLVMELQQIMRYGIQIVTNIEDTGTRDLKIINKKLVLKPTSNPNSETSETNKMEKSKKYFVIELDVKNTGERLLRPVAWLELYDLQGSFIGKYEGGKYVIYPDNSVRYKIDLGNLLPQEYKALLILDNGDENIWGNQFTVSL